MTETAAPVTALTPISQAKQMLARATTVPELTELRDFALTAKTWAKARHMGIEAENEATEVILRAEREIGKTLLQMRENGELRRVGGDYISSTPVRSGATLSETLDMPEKSANKWAALWRVLASLPDESFEDMLASARGKSERIAKWNFYVAAKGPKPEIIETSGNRDFDSLRRGAFGLLGWAVDTEGVGAPTKNDLTLLPDDELRVTATLIKALAFAYNEAKASRG